jgi:hypothetical protein
VASGDRVTPHSDALLSKLVCWGRDRAEAIARTRRALDEFEVRGVKTTLPLHRRVLANERFLSGRYDTGLIESEGLDRAPAAGPDAELRSLALALAALSGLGEKPSGRFAVALDGATHAVALERTGPGACDARVDGGAPQRIDVAGGAGGAYSVLLAGRQLACSVDQKPNRKLEVRVGASAFLLGPVDPA